jgi:hypothetical protein
VDVNQIRLWITFPKFLQWRTTNGYELSALGSEGTSTFLAFDVSVIAPGEAGTIPVRLTVPVKFANQPFEIRVWPERK